MAPEIISMKGAQFTSDIWSLGCTIIELMTGQPPFFHLPPLSALYHIAESDELPPFPKVSIFLLSLSLSLSLISCVLCYSLFFVIELFDIGFGVMNDNNNNRISLLNSKPF
jgi:serine/threonine protein kinase